MNTKLSSHQHINAANDTRNSHRCECVHAHTHTSHEPNWKCVPMAMAATDNRFPCRAVVIGVLNTVSHGLDKLTGRTWALRVCAALCMRLLVRAMEGRRTVTAGAPVPVCLKDGQRATIPVWRMVHVNHWMLSSYNDYM